MKQLLAFGLVFCTFNVIANDVLSEQQLIYLLRQDCGACHGMTLQGGLGPALLPENLKNQSITTITQTILMGRTNTAMPPWQGLLTTAQATWLAQQLVNGIPDEQ